MMTDRWLNGVLAVVIVVGLVAVAVYERPRAAEERAELLGQEVVEVDDGDAEPGTPDVRFEPSPTAPPNPERDGTTAQDEPVLAEHGATASHPAAVEVGNAVLDAGGNAVDAAVAMSYVLGVAEPFGSGVGGGGALLVHPHEGEPVAYDYRETAPGSGEIPSSNIGVPGFVAGMDHVHDEHGTLELADLIAPAAGLAEDGVEVSEVLHERLTAAAPRLPINQLPRLFPGGEPIAAGEVLRQPEHAEALRAIADQGPEVVYGGALGEQMADAVTGLELADLEDYEVLEVTPATGRFAGYEVISGGPPVSGPTVVQTLQVLEALNDGDLTPGSADHAHALAQSYRLALADRTAHVADPTAHDVPLGRLVDPGYAEELAAEVPADGFVAAEDDDGLVSPEGDTTHLVVIDRDGTMVSATNTLSNFFGSGLPVSGFFMNDQLKNFSRDADSVNHPAPGKRPRSFVAPTILATDGQPVLGIGSPGGRRIPMVIAQVLDRWARGEESLEATVAAPRIHLEDRELLVEEPLDDGADDELAARGYEVVTETPTEEYFGAVQVLRVDAEAGTVDGAADERRGGTWDAGG